ncbi:MAG TPA: hypothetical protein VF232_09395 [Gaiellaceae bacterium]
MSFLHALRTRLRFRSLDRADYAVEGRAESNVDEAAAAAAQNIAGTISHSAGPGYPPNYVNDYDDGRPRH